MKDDFITMWADQINESMKDPSMKYVDNECCNESETPVDVKAPESDVDTEKDDNIPAEEPKMDEQKSCCKESTGDVRLNLVDLRDKLSEIIDKLDKEIMVKELDVLDNEKVDLVQAQKEGTPQRDKLMDVINFEIAHKGIPEVEPNNEDFLSFVISKNKDIIKDKTFGELKFGGIGDIWELWEEFTKGSGHPDPKKDPKGYFNWVTSGGAFSKNSK